MRNLIKPLIAQTKNLNRPITVKGGKFKIQNQPFFQLKSLAHFMYNLNFKGQI